LASVRRANVLIVILLASFALVLIACGKDSPSIAADTTATTAPATTSTGTTSTATSAATSTAAAAQPRTSADGCAAVPTPQPAATP
jgi:hypothetical protein